MTPAEQLKTLRLSKGLTQEEAAAYCKRKLSSWQKWESGARNANPDTLAAIIKQLEEYRK